MATQGTPVAGRSELARRCYVIGDTLSLVAYTNAANSLGDTTIASDLVQPALANGYAPINMTGTWTVVNGIATYVHPGGGDPTWFASGVWSATVNGAAIVYGTAVLHFRDNAQPFVAALSKKLAINISNLVGP